MRILLILIGWSLVFITPAAADPATIGSVIIAGINALAGAGTLTASLAVVGNITLAEVIGGAAIVGGLIGGSMLSRQSSAQSMSAAAKETFTASESAEIRFVGRARLGGLKIFGDTAGNSRFRLTAKAKGPSGPVESYWLGGREVIVDDDGSVSSPPWAFAGGSYAKIKTKVGSDDEVAWTRLMEAFPTLWTEDHRVRGIAQTLVEFGSPGVSSPKFLKLYSGGVPDEEEVRLAYGIFDPREAEQDPDDPLSWRWSDNGPLNAMHIMCTFPEFSYDDFDMDRMAVEADRADEMVATLTGYEPRSRCWGAWSSEQKRGDILQQVLTSIGCDLIEVNEKFAIAIIDDTREAEIVIPPRHILALTAEAGPESVERPNICVVKYYSRERNYAIAEIDMTGIAWARVESEIAKVGDQVTTVELPFCPSASQAQRIARLRFALARADRWVANTNLVGLAAWGRRMMGFLVPDLGVTVLGAISPPKIDDGGASVEIPFVGWPILTAWNPATDEAAAPPTIPDIPLDSALETPAAPGVAIAVVYPDASIDLRVPFTIPAGASEFEVVYRDVTDGDFGAWSSLVERINMSLHWADKSIDLIGRVIAARHRVFSGDDSSNWSPTTTATVAIGQGALSAPSINYVEVDSVVTVTVSVTDDVNVVSIETTGSGAPGVVAVKPGQTVIWTTSGFGTWSATAATSGGTHVSSTATVTRYEP